MKEQKMHVIGIRKGRIDTDANFHVTDETDKFRRFEIKKNPPVKIEVRTLSPRKTLDDINVQGNLPRVEVQEFTERFFGGTKVVAYKARFLNLGDTAIIIED